MTIEEAMSRLSNNGIIVRRTAAGYTINESTKVFSASQIIDMARALR